MDSFIQLKWRWRSKQHGMARQNRLHASQLPVPPQGNLCVRCEELQLPTLVDRARTGIEATEAGTSCIAIINKQSIDHACPLCCQFDQLFQPPTAPLDASGRRSRVFELWRCQAKDESTIYFSIVYPFSDQKMFLLKLPAQNRPKRGDGLMAWRRFISPHRRSLFPTTFLQQANFEAVKMWIATCKHDHLSCIMQSRYKRPRTLIDCQEHRLCTDLDEPYVCLSYVWGPNEASHQIRRNRLPDDLPQTISDAMYVTLQIGMRYLWADRYCIDQSNLEAKHDAIRNMDVIYQRAEITIVAAAGDGPEHGLPGVSSAREPRVTLRLGAHIFVSVKSTRQVIESSRWSTRGWTYQEALLSKRRLVFTQNQMYFQCFRTSHLEGWEHNNYPACQNLRNSFRVFKEVGLGFNLCDIYGHLRLYYRRQLSFSTDILNAFLGILQVYFRTQRDEWRPYLSHFYGIPFIVEDEGTYCTTKDVFIAASASFAVGLAWKIYNVSTIGHVNNIFRLETPSNPFPSWTWAGFKASRQNADPGHLYFHTQRSLGVWSLNKVVRIHVYHWSGGRMNLIEHINYPEDDFTKFLPCIDITSFVISGLLTRDATDLVAFSAIPNGFVHLHERFEAIYGDVFAIYIGVDIASNGVCILVEELAHTKFHRFGSKPEYRHIGVLSFHSKLIEDSRKAVIDTLSTFSSGGPWSRQTLRLV